MRGIEFAPIEFEIDDDLASWRVEVPGRARGSAEALTGPTAVRLVRTGRGLINIEAR
jgi:hypothetical protein